MPIGWMTVLKLVPWGDVIKNAPVVADSAKKLWDTVGRKPAAAQERAATGSDLTPTTADGLPELQARLAEAEASVALLHEQMQASSTLIKALAEQNTELVRRVEIHRVRSWWLAGLLVVFGAIAGLNLAVTLSGGR
jgi:hypothetical protein